MFDYMLFAVLIFFLHLLLYNYVHFSNVFEFVVRNTWKFQMNAYLPLMICYHYEIEANEEKNIFLLKLLRLYEKLKRKKQLFKWLQLLNNYNLSLFDWYKHIYYSVEYATRSQSYQMNIEMLYFLLKFRVCICCYFFLSCFYYFCSSASFSL